MAVFVGNKKLFSKQELRNHRDYKLELWISENLHSKLDRYPFWTDEQRAEEEAAFAQFDAEYEAAKDELREQLLSLTHAELTEYFNQIGWDGLSDSYTKAERVDHYLTNA